jgi:hypothetical protein
MSVGEQQVAAFICALVGNGVTAAQIEAAVMDCETKLRLGHSIGRLATGKPDDEPSDFPEAAAVGLAYDYGRRIAKANG